MQEMWIGVIHNVCGEHEWENGECSHRELTKVEEGKQILAKDSKAAKELCKIVLDAEWLKKNLYNTKWNLGMCSLFECTSGIHVTCNCGFICNTPEVLLYCTNFDLTEISPYCSD